MHVTWRTLTWLSSRSLYGLSPLGGGRAFTQDAHALAFEATFVASRCLTKLWQGNDHAAARSHKQGLSVGLAALWLRPMMIRIVIPYSMFRSHDGREGFGDRSVSQ